ncbi:XIAP-associated factor 1 isoform 3-T3 [Hipposideros larvatus]
MERPSFVSARTETQQDDSGDQNMEGASQVCKNCKISVASAHLALHEAHCLLSLVLCPECKEPVSPEKMDEHRENRHQQVGCAMCQQSVQKHLLELHKGCSGRRPETTPILPASLQMKEWLERPAECKFCEAAVRFSKLDVHEHNCGTRTELCPDCGQLIMLRLRAQHKDVCRNEQAQLGRGEKISTAEGSIYCHYCNQMIPGTKYLQHTDKCRTVSESTKYFPTGEPGISSPSLPSQTAEDQTSTAEKDVRPKMKNTNRFRRLYENSTKQAPSGTNETMDLPLKSEHKPWLTSSVEDETAYDILKRCSQCGILLPLPTLNQHQEKCWWLASLKEKQVRKLQLEKKSNVGLRKSHR